MTKKDLLLNPWFFIGLLLLVVNDALLKDAFPGWLTGKLSDFAGLLIFPLFLAFLFPGKKRYVAVLTGLFFLWWKNPLATPFIEGLNVVLPFRLGRVVDYTDYLAMVVLPWSHFLINRRLGRRHYYGWRRLGRTALLFSAFLAFSATSMIRFEIPEGTVYLGKTHTVAMSKEDFLMALREMGYPADLRRDTLKIPWESGFVEKSITDYYMVEDFVLKDGSAFRDTIKAVKFSLEEIKPEKTRITLINVTLTEEGNVQYWKNLKSLSNSYKRILRKQLLKKAESR